MDEQPPRDAGRLAAASEAVLADLERLERLVRNRPELLAHLHSRNAILADDDHGRDRGLVVQADELRWSELAELARLAGARVDQDGHAAAGGWHQNCPACQAAAAIARIRAHTATERGGATD
ncbi:MAG: hypothetical protein V7637_5504 [Mycobacteriales bacterium]|jgi:hypothetical protein